MISERSSFVAGSEAQRHSSAIRRKIAILGTRLDSLQSLLTKLPAKQPLTGKEMNRRRHMLANLRTKVTQMASMLNMSSFRNRDNLLGPGTKYLGWWLMMGDYGAGISGRCPSPLISMVLNIGDLMAQCLHLQGIVLLKISTLILRGNTLQVPVVLMSLKAGNLGLNTVSASHVILYDLCLNLTTEDKAIDQAHRIGQTRPVTVSRLIVKNTVEDIILALQDKKRKMAALAFGEDQSGTSTAHLTNEDLRFLFMGAR
ncbi:putative P-loop containing nucleoside triphosphate hydrolase [Helianthus annuus]|uniref:P-loop containing nucleoside triphosphate hydrolase n=1 Tax=Helianthus annuus TaxID=4232 RepID=A0A251UGT1_HELAN|nr:putative P-loop containing nucleoside triphosphate hydrolase [Helianthus annuus]KAJ0566090.1 putative P-loop containing nucleoside triphosphate hydrolase [Helianthus annuus]KAJ0572924.1 putative P-loop containing nucleoside triphosphate hydrolase [Helianthus annuus]KAJ0737361.1 putative P-loop containing nucleoside triphosphate hydrolase [Helianthus annuus]KAJ0911148.1 putative P-loop containing nucleoside triphosphate hydrolase [Helianthus annuus]